jgi:hypothetical protein
VVLRVLALTPLSVAAFNDPCVTFASVRSVARLIAAQTLDPLQVKSGAGRSVDGRFHPREAAFSLGYLRRYSRPVRRGRLDAAKFTEERMIASDIKAQRLRAQAAMAFFTHYEQIEAACQRRGITVGNWCKNELGCGLTHLRKLRQLHQRWDNYTAKRQSYDGHRYGLRLAFDLVGIPTDGESNAHTGGDQNDNGQDSNNSARYWLTPPDVKAMIKQEFGEYWDACPFPLPVGHDALAMDWPEGEDVIYVNAPFTKKDELHGRGLTEYARKGIAEYKKHKKGKTIIVAIPTTDSANLLFAAGAEVWPLGRRAWIDVDTGQPWPNPKASALFILRAKRRS